MPDTRPIWTDAQRAAWKPPEEITTSAWADAHRHLPAGSPAGDRWQNDVSPALKVIMDLVHEPGIVEIWAKKAAQIGFSAAVQNVIARFADVSPCRVILLLPNEKDARKIFRSDWAPIFRLSPRLAQKRTGRSADFKLTCIRLRNGFELHTAWSGSASSMASLSFRIGVADETDKYDKLAGVEGRPVDLLRKRLRKFGDDSILLGLSTPTTTEGTIHEEHESCNIKLRFWVPCPHCGEYQPLHQDQLRWDAGEHNHAEPALKAAIIESTMNAWFECVNPACGKAIRDDEPKNPGHKRLIVPRGRWQTEDGGWKLYVDGRREGVKPPGKRVGVHYPAFYDYAMKWWDIAAHWIRAGKDPVKLIDLYNSTFGEAFKSREVSFAANQFARRCKPDPERGFVPFPAGKLQPWVMRLLLTVDTQLRGFWWVIRGWGYGLRSHRVAHGQATSFEQIEDLLYRTRWPYVGDVRQPIGVHRCGIDSGGGIQGNAEEGERRAITESVYRWCNRDPVYRLALKGNNKPMGQLVRPTRSMYSPPGANAAPFERTVHLIDSTGVRDLLFSQINNTVPVIVEGGELIEVDQWSLNDNNDTTYNQQMSNVKLFRRVKKGRTVLEYDTESEGARHDYHDVEAYQMGMAVGMDLCTALPTLEQITAERRAAPPLPDTGRRARDGRNFFVNRR